MTTFQEMSLFQHLNELRKRLVWSCIWIAIGTIVAYCFSTELFHVLTSTYYQSFPNSMLIGTGPAEALLLKLKVSVFAGIILSSPIVLYQGWLFIEPGLYPKEKKLAVPFILCASGLFFLGVWFCDQIVLPLSFQFFYEEYQSIGVTPAITISSHLSMLMQALIGFGLAFELPVIAFVLGRFGILTHRMLIDSGRYAIVAIFVISAILTPPDAVTQLLMAGPLLVLYGLSIVVVYWAQNPRISQEHTQLAEKTGSSTPPAA